MSDSTHVFARLHEIIDFLKNDTQPHSIEAIYKRFKIDDELQGLINKSDQVLYNRENRTFQFKQKYTFNNKDSVYLYIKDNFYLDLAAAKKFYEKVLDDISELESEKKISVLKNKQDQPKQAFLNLHSDIPEADEIFRDAWANVKIPELPQLKEILIKKGLWKVEKSEVIIEPRIEPIVAPKAIKRKRRMFQKKRTNLHMSPEPL
eukprot:NODE_57_length_28844_cov_0.352687.p18 type:complete len:205 gc:universal NODE_57_length_28844_cov_0.352687:23793-24407(+)